MSNDNTPQTQVTISKADLDSLVANLIEARACIEVATSAASRNQAVKSAADEDLLKRVIAFTWKEAIEFANMHVQDEVCKEITVEAHIDERVYDSLDISIRGEVETEISLGDHLDIEIPERYDGVEQTHDEILQGFLEKEKKQAEQETTPPPPAPESDVVSHVADPHNQLTGVKVVGNINLSKDNA